MTTTEKTTEVVKPVSEAEKIRKVQEACRQSLRYLCRSPLLCDVWSEFHTQVEAFLKKPSKKKLILLPRDHLKSTIVTKGWSIQQALINPNIRILIANEIWDNSRKFLRSIQNHLSDSGHLAMLFGKFRSDYWNQDECTIRQRSIIRDSGTWTTTGIEREQTSQHYDLIIADDLHGRQNVMTKEQRDKVKLYLKDLLSLLDPSGRIVVIGTRWSPDDLYGELMENKNWDSLVMGCYKPDGSPLYPERFTLDSLSQLRYDKGSYEFSNQYLNSAIDVENAPFKHEQFKFYYRDGECPATYKFLSIDPALTQKASSDFTAMIVVGMDTDGEIWIHDKVRAKMLPRQIIDEVFRLVEKWHLHRIGIEAYGYQLSLKYMIQEEQRKRKKYFTIEEMRKPKSQEKKEVFIMRLQPYVQNGLIHIHNSFTDIVDELVAFPRGKNDDAIEAISYSLDYLQKAVVGVIETEAKYGSWRWWNETQFNKGKGHVFYEFLKDLSK